MELTSLEKTYYVWIGGSCDYGHKERAGGAAVVIEHDGSIISRDVISDLHTTSSVVKSWDEYEQRITFDDDTLVKTNEIIDIKGGIVRQQSILNVPSLLITFFCCCQCFLLKKTRQR